MSRTLKAFPTLLRIGLAEAIAYRAEFFIWMLTMTMPLIMLALMSTLAEEAPIGNFDSPRFVSYYLATLIVRQLASSWMVWEMMREIREGTLSMRLLRPIHPLSGYAAESLASIPMRALFSTPIALIALYATSGRDVTRDPALIFAFVLSVAGAWLLNFCISSIIGTLALYLDSSIAIWELWLGGFMIFSGYLLPLSLFPPWFQTLAHVLPFSYLQALPVEIITGLHGRSGAFWELGHQWLYALSALGAMLLFWQRAIKRFSAFGG